MPTMKYIRIANDGRGRSKFEEVEVQQTEMPFAENVPPLLVSGTTAATGVMFVTSLADLREMEPHRTPRRQFAITTWAIAKMSDTPGQVCWPARRVGQDNELVYGRLGRDRAELERLRRVRVL
jgi:hypothetical protein